MVRGFPAYALLVLGTAVFGGCGGQTTGRTGSPSGDASVSTGGAQGSGGAASVGGAASTGGATSTGGGTGAGGTSCDPSSCPPLKCQAGKVEVILPGGCCRTTCVPASDVADGSVPSGAGGAPAGSVDAGTCTHSAPPGCSGNNWPYCAPDWTTAESWYLTCPDPNIGAYLATCGGMRAIVVPGTYESRRYFYDSAGRLAGFESVTGDSAQCEAYLGGFRAPSAPCVPLGAPCYDAGIPRQPSLDGLDAGAFLGASQPPDCKTGQAAYDAYLASQLARYNGCADDTACTSFSPPGLLDPTNPCVQPCDFFLTTAAINSQILARLDQFGTFACARCEAGPPPNCPAVSPFRSGQCISGSCVFPPN